jgi:hypothetical protein
MIDENVMKSNGLHAGNIVKEAAKEMRAAAAVTLSPQQEAAIPQELINCGSKGKV